MGRGTQRVGGGETRMQAERIGTARILPWPPGPLQVPRFHRIRGGSAKNRNRKNLEEESAQEVLDGANRCCTRICTAQVNVERVVLQFGFLCVLRESFAHFAVKSF